MKKRITVFVALLLAVMLARCQNDAPGGEIQLGREFDFTGTGQIELTNMHNGQVTVITDEQDITAITAFIGETVGKNVGSGKGYYEGSYSVVFYDEAGEILSLGFGDSDCFYMGKGDDGYPIRYILPHITVSEDVIPFLSQFDESGFVWRTSD